MEGTSKYLIATALVLCGGATMGQEIRLGGGYTGSDVDRAGEERWVGLAG